MSHVFKRESMMTSIKKGALLFFELYEITGDFHTAFRSIEGKFLAFFAFQYAMRQNKDLVIQWLRNFGLVDVSFSTQNPFNKRQNVFFFTATWPGEVTCTSSNSLDVSALYGNETNIYEGD
jgi:hypothetical protein